MSSKPELTTQTLGLLSMRKYCAEGTRKGKLNTSSKLTLIARGTSSQQCE